jgi:hypothetical protein
MYFSPVHIIVKFRYVSALFIITIGNYINNYEFSCCYYKAAAIKVILV